MSPTILYFDTIDAMSRAAAGRVCELARDSVAAHGSFTIALSGGSTPRALYERLTQSPYREDVPWQQTHLFWGDERFVPRDHAENNAAMAFDALIRHVSIPAEQTHPAPTELDTPEAAADAYQMTLREHLTAFDPSSKEKGVPVFDLILLGMGKDGHTASLFPGSPALDEEARWVVATPIPGLSPFARRVTLTFPVINAAKHVLFLISGQEKRPILEEIIYHLEQALAHYPAARVKPDGALNWFVA